LISGLMLRISVQRRTIWGGRRWRWLNMLRCGGWWENCGACAQSKMIKLFDNRVLPARRNRKTAFWGLRQFGPLVTSAFWI
jgi:hypothetical protein